MGFFGAAHGWGEKGPPSLKSVTHPTMMKLGSYTLPKEDPKNIDFAILRNTDIDWILIPNFYLF